MKKLRRSPRWLVLSVVLVAIEIVVVLGFRPKCSVFSLTDLLTFLLVLVTTIYVGMTFGLWDESRQMRYVQFHPSLEISFFKSVDAIDVPYGRDLAQEYLSTVSPGVAVPDSDTELRHENLRFKNVGQGEISALQMRVKVHIGGCQVGKPLALRLKPHLRHGEERLITLLRFGGMPTYKVEVSEISYEDYFGVYTHSHGETQRVQSPPHRVPASQWKLFFHDDFAELPQGKGWHIDAWSPTFGKQISALIKLDQRQLVHSGDVSDYASHHNQQGVSYVDLNDRLTIGRSYVVQCEARSDPGTDAQLQLLCHDLPPDVFLSEKSRQTKPLIPGSDWASVTLVYTATQTSNLRIHLRYIPGQGIIYVRDLKVFEIQE